MNRFAAAFATLAIVAGWIVDARGADTDEARTRAKAARQAYVQPGDVITVFERRF